MALIVHNTETQSNEPRIAMERVSLMEVSWCFDGKYDKDKRAVSQLLPSVDVLC